MLCIYASVCTISAITTKINWERDLPEAFFLCGLIARILLNGASIGHNINSFFFVVFNVYWIRIQMYKADGLFKAGIGNLELFFNNYMAWSSI